MHPGGELAGRFIRGRAALLASSLRGESHVSAPCLRHRVPRRRRGGAQDRLDVNRVEPLDRRCDEGGSRVDAERCQPSMYSLIDAKRGERRTPRLDRRGSPRRSWLMKPSQRAGAKPRRGPFRVSQRSCLPGSCRQRETGSALGQLLVTERDQDGKAVQPRPMKVAEDRRQRGIVVLRR